MKKLLLLTALLLCTLAQAQNKDLLLQANKCDAAFARTFADEIVSGTKTKYTYFDTADSKYLRTKTFIYIKEGLSELEKKGVEAEIHRYKHTAGRYIFDNKDCMNIHFDSTIIGGNAALEIEGTKVYSFSMVSGKFLDLFPFYQKNIEPNATTEKTYEANAVYSVRKDSEGYWYNLTQDSHGWYLKNMSSRIK